MYVTIADELRAAGRAEGLAAGRTAGFSEGRCAAKAEAVLAVLERRGMVVLAGARQRILASRDESELSGWFQRSFSVTTPDALFEPGSG